MRAGLRDGTCETSIGLLLGRWTCKKGCRAPQVVIRGTPIRQSSQWRVSVKDKIVKREYMRNKKACQRANPFSEIGRWLFIAPVAKGKIIISLWRFPSWTVKWFALRGSWLGLHGYRQGLLRIIWPSP